MCKKTWFSFLLVALNAAIPLEATGKIIWLTVFLHGGGLHPAYFSMRDFFSVINEHSQDSTYAITTRILRNDPFFFQVQPMNFPGLRRAYPTKEIKYGSHIFGYMYDSISRLINPHEPPTLYYSYGWAGLLCPRSRRLAARRLYLELSAKVEQLRQRGFEPHVRLIGYSHGGNVSLNLAEEARNHPPQKLVIDEFILLATPIQRGIQNFVTSPIFKKVYLFYSVGDNVQVNDFLSSPQHYFSSHTFFKTKNFTVPDKVTQIQVRLMRETYTIRQKDGSFKTLHKHEVVNPSHCEMFFFGWTPEWYRRHLPIRPLSVGMLMPLMLQDINKLHLNGQHLEITIEPEKEKMVIHVKKTKQTFDQPFFSQQQFEKIRSQLWSFRPKGFVKSAAFKKYYRNRMKQALLTAKREAAAQRELRRLHRKLVKNHKPAKRRISAS